MSERIPAQASPGEAAEGGALRPGRLKRLTKLIMRSKLGFVGFVLLTFFLLMAIFAPLLAPHDPAKTNLADKLLPPKWAADGKAEYVLGTDNLGRDILSRLIYGSRVSFIVGFGSVAIAGTIGMTLGLIAGYYRRWIDALIMRVVDALLAIPTILFMLLLLFIVGSGMSMLIVAIGLTQWVNFARVVRSEVLSVRERDYVLAARSGGAGDVRIIAKYIMPNVMSSFIVVATMSVGTAVLLEAALSFLGLGIQPPDMSWGSMLSDGRQYLATSWWVATFPGLTITLAVLAVMFIGDGLRDVLDPKLKR